MHQMNRMARGAIGTLVNIARGAGMMGVPMARKGDLTEALLAATGCRLDISAGRRVLVRGDAVITSDHDAPTQEVADAMATWMEGGEPPMAVMPMAMPAGGREIADRMGLPLGRTMILLEALHYAVRTEGERSFEMTRSRMGVKACYRLGTRLRWENGLVTLKCRILPGSVGAALAGKPLSVLVDEPTIADRIIRKVCDVDPRDGIMRIVTRDEGRHVIMDGG